MLSSKRDRFMWSKEDRLPEMSFFRLLRQRWRPTTRVVVYEEQFDTRGRRYSLSATKNPYQQAAKSSWTPWLWVGS
jgi:hypothetical protein